MQIIIGGGGMAKDFISYKKPTAAIILDDFKEGSILGIPIRSGVTEFLEEKGQSSLSFIFEVYNCIGSSGNNEARNKMFKLLKENKVKTTNVLLSSYIAKDVEFGENVLTNIGSQIHHSSKIGNSVVISPSVTICGDCILEDNVFIGAGATIIQGITIGENSIIGAGSVVTVSVPKNELHAGNPCRKIREIEREA